VNAGQHGISRPDAGTENQDSVKTDKCRLQTKADHFKPQIAIVFVDSINYRWTLFYLNKNTLHGALSCRVYDKVERWNYFPITSTGA